jgi:sigma-B regulation protein RsbU (phosphoserine phosphatase)
VRDWLRRVMPRVAIAAALLFILKGLFGDTRLYGSNLVGLFMELVTFLVISFTTIYYCFKGLRWLKRRLLWRVRRRLVITYLFVGLTPIVLLGMLGFLFAISASIAEMPRTVMMHLEEIKGRSRSSARALVTGLAHLPLDADERRIKAWLDDQNALLQASLPGARVAVWRDAAGGVDAAALGHSGAAQFTSEPADEQAHVAASERVPLGAPLPEWLRGRDEWSGFAFVALPEEVPEYFAPASVRALVRGKVNDRAVTLLLVVPVSPALAQELRQATGVKVHPFFIDPRKGKLIDNAARSNDAEPPVQGPNYTIDREHNQVIIDEGGKRVVIDLNKDQFGEPLPNNSAGPVFLNVTNWQSGEESEKVAFLFSWSFAEASKQILGGEKVGKVLMQALIAIAIFFLVLELLALISAAWMTRAVTSTVHKLYRATEFIKRGDFSHRVQVRSHDQLGELAAAFNEMSANVELLLQERIILERLEREVEIAAEVQAQLFPRRVPDLLTVEVAAECRAARGVAGDYYDYVEIAPGLIAFALGDVSGKGLSASLVMSNLQASLRAQTTITAERLSIAERAIAVSTSDDGGATDDRLRRAHAVFTEMDGAVARKITNINTQLCQSTESNRFATLVLAIYEDRSRLLRYTNAGHNPPILVRADGTVERLTTGGMMIGAFDWARYDEASITLGADDLLLIFSDGISEAENQGGEEYGELRLVQFAVEHREFSADALRRAIFDEIDDWAGTQERGDDQTLVIIKGSRQ